MIAGLLLLCVAGAFFLVWDRYVDPEVKMSAGYSQNRRAVYFNGEKIQGAQSLEEALQIAVKEVGLSLNAPQAAVQLKISD